MKMLQDNFYRITDRIECEGNWLLTIHLNASHPVYDGHFPEHAVVPGVCTLQMIKECAEQILSEKLFLGRISSCKFLLALHPVVNNELQLKLTLKEETENVVSLFAEGKSQGTEFIKLKAILNIV